MGSESKKGARILVHPHLAELLERFADLFVSLSEEERKVALGTLDAMAKAKKEGKKW